MNKELQIPINTFFYNTLGELSQAAIEAESIVEGTTGTNPLDPAVINVTETGAVGDGVTDDTIAIQAAIDLAAGTTDQRTIVLIPNNFICVVSPQEMDWNLGQAPDRQGVCLWVKDRITIRIDGILKVSGVVTNNVAAFNVPLVVDSVNNTEIPDFITIFENYNAYRTPFGNELNESYASCSDGSTVTFSGVVDLSTIVAGQYLWVQTEEDEIYERYKKILTVGSNYVTVEGTYTTFSDVAWYIDNQIMDNDITIDGLGVIDLEGYYTRSVVNGVDAYRLDLSLASGVTSPQNYKNGKTYAGIEAFTFTRCKRLTIRNITIKHGGMDRQGTIAFSTDVRVDGVKLIHGLYGSFVGEGISFQAGEKITITNCLGYRNLYDTLFFFWNSRNVQVSNSMCDGLPYDNAYHGGLVSWYDFGEWGYYPFVINWIYYWPEDTGDVPYQWYEDQVFKDYHDTVPPMVFNIKINGNIIKHCATGISLIGSEGHSYFSKGVLITDNIITRNKYDGIFFEGIDKLNIVNNIITENGYDWPEINPDNWVVE